MRAVLDTNVLVSAALTANGNSRAILGMAFNGTITLFYSPGMLAEYLDVFARPKFLPISENGTSLVRDIRTIGCLVVPDTSAVALPDESDRLFYDVAVYADAVLVTGNKKHYPEEPFIVSPSEFITRAANGLKSMYGILRDTQV